MLWNSLPGEEFLRLWKNLRTEIKDDNIHDQLSKIANFYASTPFGARTLDYYNPKDWPTPWEILFYGSFCRSSISLLIFYTITMVTSKHKVEIQLIDDNGEIYLIPVVDDQFVLNVELGMVSSYLEVKKDIKVLRVFSQKEIKSIT